MQPGLHVIEARKLADLERHGVVLPRPWTGLLDGLRTVEGLEPEPPADQPFVLAGLTALLRQAPDGADALLRVVRGTLGEGRAYFSWKKLPVVLVVEGHVDDPGDETGLWLEAEGRRWSLAPLLGTGLQAARPGVSGWWWSPQWL